LPAACPAIIAIEAGTEGHGKFAAIPLDAGKQARTISNGAEGSLRLPGLHPSASALWLVVTLRCPAREQRQRGVEGAGLGAVGIGPFR